MTPRVIAHVDMDAFFASIERKAHPDWKNEPIIVCVFSGRTPDSGVVSSATYDARAHGIHAGMPIIRAKQILPTAHFVGVSHDVYSRVSDEVFTRLVSYSDEIELASIDEAYVEMTSRANGDYSIAADLLKKFQSEIKNTFHLTCSVGLGPNKLVAKMASDENKPNGFTIIPPQNVSTFLDALPVSRLLGVGPKTLEILTGMGVTSIATLRQQGIGDLISQLGNAKAHYLFSASRGIDETPVQSNKEKKQQSRLWTLDADTLSWEPISAGVDQHAEELWDNTAGKGTFFTQIGVMGITSSLNQVSKTKTSDLPFSSREMFRQSLEGLFKELFSSSQEPFRRIGIRVSGFTAPPKQKRLSDW